MQLQITFHGDRDRECDCGWDHVYLCDVGVDRDGDGGCHGECGGVVVVIYDGDDDWDGGCDGVCDRDRDCDGDGECDCDRDCDCVGDCD